MSQESESSRRCASYASSKEIKGLPSLLVSVMNGFIFDVRSFPIRIVIIIKLLSALKNYRIVRIVKELRNRVRQSLL